MKGFNGLGYTLHRAGITKRIPVAQCVDDDFTPAGGVWNPFSPIAAEHVVSHVVENLYAFDLGVNTQCCLQLFSRLSAWANTVRR